jgi:hypothetical protein
MGTVVVWIFAHRLRRSPCHRLAASPVRPVTPVAEAGHPAVAAGSPRLEAEAVSRWAGRPLVNAQVRRAAARLQPVAAQVRRGTVEQRLQGISQPAPEVSDPPVRVRQRRVSAPKVSRPHVPSVPPVQLSQVVLIARLARLKALGQNDRLGQSVQAD